MTDPRGPADSASDLPRALGLFDSVSIVLGIVIGAGIFLMPSLVARAMGSAGWIFAAWIFTGALSFFGALAFAELGAMLPATGGQYVYLREAWGSPRRFYAVGVISSSASPLESRTCRSASPSTCRISFRWDHGPRKASPSP